MKKTSMVLTTVVIASLGMAGAAFAHGKGGQRGAGLDKMFEEMDANSDGKITAAEMKAAADARFAEADADGDGFLSAEEVAARGEQRRANRGERMIERLDANEDGKLSAEEVAARNPGERLIERLDADGDGALTKAELEDGRKMRKGRRGNN